MTGDHEHHRPFEDLAVRHVMGALDDAEAGAFRSHLLDCDECRARVGELRAIDSELASVERADRRERAAQKVQTRQPEKAEAQPPPPPSRRGAGRVVVVVGILLVIVLSSWNFVLRGQNEGLTAALRAEADASATINFGESWDVTTHAAGIEGVARVEGTALAVMVRGTDDRASYEVALYSGDGDRLARERIRSRDDQVRYFRSTTPAEVARVDVTLPRGSGETIILRAVSPELTADATATSGTDD